MRPLPIPMMEPLQQEIREMEGAKLDVLVKIDQMSNTRSRVRDLKDLGKDLLTYFPESGDYGYGPFILPRGLVFNQYLGLVLTIWIVKLMAESPVPVMLKNIPEDVNKMMSPFVMEV